MYYGKFLWKRFCGNKHQKVTKADVPSDPKSPAFQSKSAKKINFCAESVTDNVINLDKSSSYMIMNTIKYYRRFSFCPDCQNKLCLKNHVDRKQGYALCLALKCLSCDFSWDVMSSNTVPLPTTTAGKKPYDINLRMYISFSREIGIYWLCWFRNQLVPFCFIVRRHQLKITDIFIVPMEQNRGVNGRKTKLWEIMRL